MDSFSAQTLSSLSWGFAKAGVGKQAGPLFEAVAASAQPQLDTFKPQELSLLLWSFATAGHAAPALFDALASAAVPRLGEFKPQEVANAVWAFAKLEMREEALLKAVSSRARETERELSAQDLANTVWAFAKLEVKDEALMEALPREDTARLQTLQRWTKAVCGLYALAVVFDVVVAIFDSRRAVEWLGGAGTDLGSLLTWANVAYFVRHVLELLRAREAAPLKPVERWLPRI